jgi:hypothetical protein
MKSSLFLIFNFIFIAFLNSCDTNEIITTGIEGKVYRGPINPVEILGVDNNAPFSALFHVYDHDQKHLITSFNSNAEGQYKVMLVAGNYVIKPDVTAPLMHPSGQIKYITLINSGILSLDLFFDTGIR